MSKELTPISIERSAERIRQERETFNQRKQQDKNWFVLKMVMGFFAVLMLASILCIASYVLFNYDKYPSSVLTAASVAIFIDCLGLVVAVWKIVLNPQSITKLEPVTMKDEE